MDVNDYPTIDDLNRISKITDPIIRNLQITQCYHEISGIVAKRICFNANWCTYATWASKQAGQTIRKEDLLHSLSRMLDTRYTEIEDTIAKIILLLNTKKSINDSLNSICKALSMTVVERASESVAKGNKKVFEEIGYEFARFISLCLMDTNYNKENIEKFCSELKPGLPPDGQQNLLWAFTSYYNSIFETNNKRKAELILYANLQVGFHEQTRLQPEIEDSLNAAIVNVKEFRDNLINAIFPSRGLLNKVKIFILWLFGKLALLDSLIDSFLNSIRQNLRRIITEHMMTITFPPALCINLGKDLSADYPVELKVIENNDLGLLLAKIDPTPDSVFESGAVDWANLSERMHFITDLFRCYQQSENLSEEPFNTTQVKELKSGKLPEGPL